MPEIARFYGIVIKMFLSRRSMNQAISMPCTANTWESSISVPWK